MGAASDKRSGPVTWLPATLCCWPADANADEKEGGDRSHCYRIEGDRFVHVNDVLMTK